MKFNKILMVMIVAASVANAATAQQLVRTPVNNVNDKVGEEIHAVMSKASQYIDTLDVKAAEQEINKLKLMANDIRYKAFVDLIHRYVKNLEGALKFNMKHRHGELKNRIA